MTLKERIELLCDRLAAEIKALKKQQGGGSVQAGTPSVQVGKVVFNLDLLRYNRVDGNWLGLVNGQVANSSTYILRFPISFDDPPVVMLTSERKSPSWRFLEIREVTKDYAVIGCNYWGSDLTLHWMAIAKMEN